MWVMVMIKYIKNLFNKVFGLNIDERIKNLGFKVVENNSGVTIYERSFPTFVDRVIIYHGFGCCIRFCNYSSNDSPYFGVFSLEEVRTFVKKMEEFNLIYL